MAAAWAAIGAFGLAAGATGQTVLIAFGDSITAGVGDDPTRQNRGYPPRLEATLRSGGADVRVLNRGLGGEDTVEGLTRIDSVLAETNGDVLLLMEGTNDISRDISVETTRFNLTQMADKAEREGMSVVHATLIPRLPNAKVDPQNVLNLRLAQNIRDMAAFRSRDLADPFEVFGSEPDLFNRLYYSGSDDPVGHPNAAGYDLLAQIFADLLRSLDRVPPVIGLSTPQHGATGVSPTAAIELDVLDFGAGLDLASIGLLLNDVITNATVTPGADASEAHVSYQPPSPLSGTVRVRLRARDLASTPNQVDREVLRFAVGAVTPLAGDLDLDGRVDGRDLVALARRFGASVGQPLYLASVDLNSDGSIDGADLAILASNFGRSS